MFGLGSIIYDWELLLIKSLRINDRSLEMMRLYDYSKNPRRFSQENLIDSMLKNENFDLISLITLGFLHKDDPEVAYSAYYIAHLMDHQKIKANSDLPFDLKQGEKGEMNRSEEEKNVDKILKNLNDFD